MIILGIETSCDETGVALYDSEKGLLAHALHSQVALHAPYGGVVPELASRDHLARIQGLIEALVKETGLALSDIDGVAYTKGPGLMGALLIGAMVATAIGFANDVPVIGVHHLEGHILAAELDDSVHIRYPYLALLVSGGHTELIAVRSFGQYETLGDTLDDAVGEAFDKVARLLGLPYPGGPQLAQLADQGNGGRFTFPRPMLDRPGLDFSFSGLKTFAANVIRNADKDLSTQADIAASFQDAVVDTLTKKCLRALKQTGFAQLVVAGGVGANLTLRRHLTKACQQLHIPVQVVFPKLEFCTDNGAMIAYVGYKRLLKGDLSNYEVSVYPRWPLGNLC